MMKNFHSNADEIRYYFDELLNDGMEHDRKEMIQYVKQKSANGSRFTEGMYTGALRNMVEASEMYSCVRRGVYQKKVQAAETRSEDLLSNRVLEILSNTRAQLMNCNINVIDIPRMSERDKKVSGQLGMIVRDIDRWIEKLK